MKLPLTQPPELFTKWQIQLEPGSRQLSCRGEGSLLGGAVRYSAGSTARIRTGLTHVLTRSVSLCRIIRGLLYPKLCLLSRPPNGPSLGAPKSPCETRGCRSHLQHCAAHAPNVCLDWMDPELPRTTNSGIHVSSYWVLRTRRGLRRAFPSCDLPDSRVSLLRNALPQRCFILP